MVQLLTEELHIADEVKELTRYVKNIVKNYGVGTSHFDVNRGQYVNYLVKRGYNSENIKEYAFFEYINFTVNIENVSNFDDQGGGTHTPIYSDDDIVFTGDNPNKRQYNVRITNNKADIILNLYLVNGQIIPQSYDEVIQHELQHAYQNMRHRHGQKNTLTKTYVRMGEKYAGAKRNVNSSNPYAKDISEIYYYLNRSEQDSYANGLYSSLTSNKPTNLQSFLNTTRQYQVLNSLKNIYKNIEYWKRLNGEEYNQFKEARNLFFPTSLTDEQVVNSLKNHLHQELPRFEKKLSGVVSKYQKDITPTQQKTMTQEESEKLKKRFMELLTATHY